MLQNSLGTWFSFMEQPPGTPLNAGVVTQDQKVFRGVPVSCDTFYQSKNSLPILDVQYLACLHGTTTFCFTA